MILLDIKKALDSVWHRGLIYKLYKYKFPTYIIKLLISYLRKRTFIVSGEGIDSGPRKIRAGVPQGSILGPILFLLFINDLPINSKTQLALFADDTALLSGSWKRKTAVQNVEAHFKRIHEHFQK